VWDPELIEVLRPLLQLPATIDEELEMIEASSELTERLARVRGMTDEAEHQLAVRLDEAQRLIGAARWPVDEVGQ